MQLKTQVLQMKEELARKTNNIETIRDTLKVNRVKVESRKSGRVFDIEASLDDNEIDEAVKDFELAQNDSMEDAGDDDEDLVERPDLDSVDDDDDDDPFFDQNDNDMDDDDEYGQEFDVEQQYRDQFGQEQDPQVLKLQDKVKLLKHRCVASLGNNLYERAIDFIKDQVQQNTPSEQKRQGLIQILGEESIGLWAILDQIIFYEELVVEIQSIAQQSSQASTDGNSNQNQNHVV